MPRGPGTPTSREPSLAHAPVVLVLDPRGVPFVEAGAARAGGAPAIRVLHDPDAPAILDAVLEAGSDCVIALCSTPAVAIAVATEVASRRGRAVPALGIDDGRPDLPTLEVLRAPGLDPMNVAVPALEGVPRTRLWDALRAERVEERHHLVEVDGRPGSPRPGPGTGPSSEVAGTARPLEVVAALAAGAAGVLAGRMVSAGRAWRPAAP